MEKIILFDGSNFDRWVSRDGSPVTWTIEDGAMTVVKKNIVSTFEFADAEIHVEFRLPNMPEAEGQAKANSGVYVHGCYEIQVLDSSGKKSVKSDDCGGIYKKYAPLENACLGPDVWQAYDITIVTPKQDEKGKIVEAGSLTVYLNGKLIHDRVPFRNVTPGGLSDMPVNKGPLMLQDHGDKVSFRNVWVRPLSDIPAEKKIASSKWYLNWKKRK